AEIAVQEGATVEVGTVVAYIETEKGAVAAPAATEKPAAEEKQAAAAEAAPAEAPAREAKPAAAAAPAERDGAAAEESAEERLRRRSTPLVRKIAAEHGVDIGEVEGTGHAGRVTKQDIMSFIEGRERKPAAAAQEAAAPARTPAARPAAAVATGADEFWSIFYGQVRHPEFPARDGDEVK